MSFDDLLTLLFHLNFISMNFPLTIFSFGSMVLLQIMELYEYLAFHNKADYSFHYFVYNQHKFMKNIFPLPRSHTKQQKMR